MSKCVNDNCNNDPFDNEMSMQLATSDGDFACCEPCLKAFLKQREIFFENIHDDAWFDNWMAL